MSTKKPKGRAYPTLPGTTHANIQLPEGLHESMKAIRRARRERELEDIKLCRIYREAIEQYVNAKPQQQLLAHFEKSLRIAG